MMHFPVYFFLSICQSIIVYLCLSVSLSSFQICGRPPVSLSLCRVVHFADAIFIEQGDNFIYKIQTLFVTRSDNNYFNNMDQCLFVQMKFYLWIYCGINKWWLYLI